MHVCASTCESSQTWCVYKRIHVQVRNTFTHMYEHIHTHNTHTHTSAVECTNYADENAEKLNVKLCSECQEINTDKKFIPTCWTRKLTCWFWKPPVKKQNRTPCDERNPAAPLLSRHYQMTKLERRRRNQKVKLKKTKTKTNTQVKLKVRVKKTKTQVI